MFLFLSFGYYMSLYRYSSNIHSYTRGMGYCYSCKFLFVIFVFRRGVGLLSKSFILSKLLFVFLSRFFFVPSTCVLLSKHLIYAMSLEQYIWISSSRESSYVENFSSFIVCFLLAGSLFFPNVSEFFFFSPCFSFMHSSLMLFFFVT